MLCNQRAIMLGFAANDGRPKIGADESLDCASVGRAVVNPHLQRRKLFADAAQRPDIVAVPLDRVEIGDIKGREGVDRQQATNDIDRVAGSRKRRFERPIRRPIAAPRADDLTMQEVNDWDNLQHGLRGPVKERFASPHKGSGGPSRDTWPKQASEYNFRSSLMKVNASKRALNEHKR